MGARSLMVAELVEGHFLVSGRKKGRALRPRLRRPLRTGFDKLSPNDSAAILLN